MEWTKDILRHSTKELDLMTQNSQMYGCMKTLNNIAPNVCWLVSRNVEAVSSKVHCNCGNFSLPVEFVNMIIRQTHA